MRVPSFSWLFHPSSFIKEDDPMDGSTINFFSLTEEEREKLIGYYKRIGVFKKESVEKVFENVYFLDVKGEKSPGYLVPPYVRNKFLAFPARPLEWVLKEEAGGRGTTVGVAESCSGGLIASRITDVPGSSQYFNGGVVAYSNVIKMKILGVDEEMIRSHGAVSSPVAIEMAKGASRVTGGRVCLSVTGVAGPEGGTKMKPVGTVWFGLHTPSGTTSISKRFKGTREEIKFQTSSHALFLLIEAVREGGEN